MSGTTCGGADLYQVLLRELRGRPVPKPRDTLYTKYKRKLAGLMHRIIRMASELSIMSLAYTVLCLSYIIS